MENAGNDEESPYGYWKGCEEEEHERRSRKWGRQSSSGTDWTPDEQAAFEKYMATAHDEILRERRTEELKNDANDANDAK